MDKSRVLSKQQIDALKEVGTIGAGHAANAFAQLTDKKTMISVPEVKVVPIDEIMELVGPPESLMAVVYMTLMGDWRGRTLLIFPKHSAFNLVDLLMKRPAGQTKYLHEIDYSALKEVGNILTGAFLTALSEFLDVSFIPSVPQLAYDMVGGILEAISVEFSQDVDYVFCIQTEFVDPSLDIEGNFILISDREFLDIIIEKIDIKIATFKKGTG